MSDPEDYWQLKASCRGMWDIFDGIEDESGNDHYPHIEEAQERCSTCPVYTKCRQESNGEHGAIWAGRRL